MKIVNCTEIKLAELRRKEVSWLNTHLKNQNFDDEINSLIFTSKADDSLLDKLTSIRIEKREKGKHVSKLIFSEVVTVKGVQHLVFANNVLNIYKTLPKILNFLLLSKSKYKLNFANLIIDVDNNVMQISKESLRDSLNTKDRYQRYFDFEKYLLTPLLNDFELLTGINIELSKITQGNEIKGFKFKLIDNVLHQEKSIKQPFRFINPNHAVVEVSNILMQRHIGYDLVYQASREIFNNKKVIRLSNNQQTVEIIVKKGSGMVIIS